MDEREQARLAELVRLGERLVDLQIRGAEGQDEKSRHFITTATGLLTAAAAFTGFLGRDLPTPFMVPFVIGLLSGFGSLGWSLALFVRAYTGSRLRPARLVFGWAPELLERAGDEGDVIGAIHRSTLRGTTRWFRQNERAIGRAAHLRRHGILALLFSGGFLVISLIYGVIANGT